MSQAEKKTISTESIKAGKVLPKDMVTVYGTGASKYMQTGKPYQVHSAVVQKLIDNGHATKEAPKEKPAK